MLPLPREGTLLELLPFYLNDCLVRDQSPRTVEGKRCSLQAFVQWCGTVPDPAPVIMPVEISEEVLEEYRVYLYDFRQPRNGKPLDVATRRRRLTDVKTWLKWLKRKKVIVDNTVDDFELPRVPRRLNHRYLTMAQVEALMAQTVLFGQRGVRDRAVLETYFATGIRRMELAKLDLSDLDVAEQLLTVRFGKGGRQRRVPIAGRALSMIRRYLRDVRPVLARLDSGSALFLDNDGKRFREQQLTRIVSRYKKLAGIDKPGSCNLFRHTTATLMLQNQADIRVVQELLGHADISTTTVYTHIALPHVQDVYQRTHPAACGFTRYSDQEKR